MTRPTLIAAAAAALTMAVPAAAQDVKGDWRGSLEVAPGTKLRIAIHVSESADGKLSGTLDSIDQGGFGIPLADIVRTGDQLRFTVPSVGGRYAGKWDAASKRWIGDWSQGPATLALSFVSAPSAKAPPPLPANWDLPGDTAIKSLISSRIADRPGTGMVVGVIEGPRRAVVTAGPAKGGAFDGNTLFEIGSISKVFTSLLLADMALRGEVSLDDPITKYLPAGARTPERKGKAISLRDLATHRSGLPRLPDNMKPANPLNPYADYGEAQMLDFLARYELTRDIGTEFEYSNLGVGLLGYLLARRAGTTYEALLKRRILVPLGMSDTAITLSTAQKARFPQAYDSLMQPTPPWHLPLLAGAGAIRSTAKDMLIFLEAAMGAKRTPLAKAFALMLAERSPGPSATTQMGLGWIVAKTANGELMVHDGGTGGFRSSIGYEPAKKRGVVVLTNSAREPSANDITQHLLIGTPIAVP